MTKVINLYAGSGAGKSTIAAGLFYEMKLRGLNVELVREYVKTMAWQGIKIGPYDQPYIFGMQLKHESTLYGKVDYIITDSPLLLSPVYELYYRGDAITEESANKFIKKACENGVEHINFFLNRTQPFDTKGRFETEQQAKEVDDLLKKKLNDWGYNYVNIDEEGRDKVNFILKYLNIK
jgi:nicotinamide riboside kinase